MIVMSPLGRTDTLVSGSDTLASAVSCGLGRRLAINACSAAWLDLSTPTIFSSWLVLLWRLSAESAAGRAAKTVRSSSGASMTN